MDVNVIKLVTLIVAALIVTLALIAVEFRTHAVRPGATVLKTVVAVALFGLLISVI